MQPRSRRAVIALDALGLAALAALFAAVGLRFVLAWVRFWQRDEAAPMSESLFLLLPVPLAWALHFFGLRRVWYTFALTEVLTLALALVLYRRGAPKATRIAGTHR